MQPLNDPELLYSNVYIYISRQVSFTLINKDVNYADIQMFAYRRLRNIHINSMFNFKGRREGAKKLNYDNLWLQETWIILISRLIK